MIPQPAATLVLLRAVEDGMEVLMTQRQPWLFGGGWWVFPGGSIEPQDWMAGQRKLVAGGMGEEDIPWVAAALRETAEEVGLWLSQPLLAPGEFDAADVYGSLQAAQACLDASQAVLLSNWVTPRGIEKRFDTRFYVAEWVGSHAPVADPQEVAAVEWVAPLEMLERDRSVFPLIQPTFETLVMLSRFSTPQAVVDYARRTEVKPYQPPLQWSPNPEMVTMHPAIPVG